jgi:hypothetical protein
LSDRDKKVKDIRSEKKKEIIDIKSPEVIEEVIKEIPVKEEQSPQEKLNDVLKKNDAALVNQINTLSERITAIEVSLTATSKVLDEKSIASQDDINKAIDKEQQRLQAYQQIQTIKGNYRIRLELCKKWDIKADTTNIITQLREDKSIPEKEKLEIAAEYGVDVRFFLQQVD